MKNIWINKFNSNVPGLSHRTYFSKSMRREIGYAIYLPPDYYSDISDSGNKKNNYPVKDYPVIYWLHGKGGDEATGFRVKIPEMFHNAIIKKILEPAIMVFPNCGSYSMFCDSLDRSVMGESILIKEIIPLIEQNYIINHENANRGIEGFSMGGFGAVKLAFKYPELFKTVVTYAGSFHDLNSVLSNRPEVFKQMFGNDPDYFQKNSPYIFAEKNRDAIKKNIKIMFINGSDDFTLSNNLKLNKTLDSLSINYYFKILNGFIHTPTPYYNSEGLNGFKFHLKK